MSEEKKDLFRLYVPLMFFMMAMLMLANRPYSSHYVPIPPRPKITIIHSSDPQVLVVKAFADSHHLVWEISPDAGDGTSYCVNIHSEDYKFYGLHCRDTIKEAADMVVDEWNRRDVKVGGGQK